MKAPATAAPATPQPAEREAAPTAQADHRPVAVAQRQLQTALDASPRQVAQRQQAAATQPRPNRTGLPDQLKTGVENLSGYSLDDVKVHYNSAKPAQLQAHAYAQGTDIHVAPGQEKHLPHEAWHVVQQKQGRVRATRQLKGVRINDSAVLEKEASVMGTRSLQTKSNSPTSIAQTVTSEVSQQPELANSIEEGLVQRLVLPLDDIQSLGEKGGTISKEQEDSARIMTEAVGNRVRATNESVARPHQVANDKNTGGLASIGITEELRILGHGQRTRLSGGAAVQIGGYTPQALAHLLITMGLPSNYQGEIYLSGCITAVGPSHGFLGAFYQVMSAHCNGCIVRGNLGNSTTFSDGTQGVWSGKITEENYKKQIAAFGQMANQIQAELEEVVRNVKSKKISITTAKKEIEARRQSLESIAVSKETYNKQVYDTTGAYTVALPNGAIQAANAVNAIVYGVVTSASQVNTLMNRIDEIHLREAQNTLEIARQQLQKSAEALVAKSAALANDYQGLKIHKQKK